MSVGRQLCKHLIDMAEEMRRYAGLVAEFDSSPDTEILYCNLMHRAEGLEALVPPVLAFEGETPKLLTAGAAS
jgi:hypothetical protein